MVVPGTLISLATFPGVMFHEWAHKSACQRYDIPVYEVVYFRLGNPAGYVHHAEPSRFRESFAVSGAPFVLNSILAVLLILPYPYLQDFAASGTVAAGWLSIGLAWLALSVGMHAVPSRGDARNVWRRMRADWRLSPFVLLAAPVVMAIYLFDLLRFFWADALYALGLAAVGLTVGSLLV